MAYRSPAKIVADLLAQLEDGARGDARYSVSAETLDDLRIVPVVDPDGVTFKVWARGAAGTWLIGTWSRVDVDEFIATVVDLTVAADARTEGSVDASRRSRV